MQKKSLYDYTGDSGAVGKEIGISGGKMDCENGRKQDRFDTE